MAFTIDFGRTAMSELKDLRVFDQRRIVEAIERQLPHEPTVQSRNRKQLEGISPTFDHVPPVWELRVGEFRVFYDVDEQVRVVHIRAVRQKAPEQTTGEIIS